LCCSAKTRTSCRDPRAYKSSAEPPTIYETTLGEADCATLRECAFDLRCAVSRLWVQCPCTGKKESLQICIEELMGLTNRVCTVANKTVAPSKESYLKESRMEDAA